MARLSRRRGSIKFPKPETMPVGVSDPVVMVSADDEVVVEPPLEPPPAVKKATKKATKKKSKKKAGL